MFTTQILIRLIFTMRSDSPSTIDSAEQPELIPLVSESDGLMLLWGSLGLYARSHCCMLGGVGKSPQEHCVGDAAGRLASKSMLDLIRPTRSPRLLRFPLSTISRSSFSPAS